MVAGVRPAVRGVERISLAQVASLQAAGALAFVEPPFPAQSTTACRVPGLPELADVEWWIAGAVPRPSGLLALREAYDLKATRDVLEIVGVSGSKIAVGRLIAKAVELARERGRRVVGDVDFRHPGITDYGRRLGFRSARVRWELEPA